MGIEALVETKRAPVSKRPGGGLRVLVVDDDDDLRRAIREAFLMRGFAVNTARDGSTAVKRAQRERYDVVVSDIHMPGMDGFEVTRKLKRLQDAPRVILLTANPERKVCDLAREAGAERIIPKPVGIGRLVSLVEELAAREGVVETQYGV